MNAGGGPMNIIIDTDAGGDDAVALLLLLATNKVNVVAITSIYGNTYEENVQKNILKILTIANRTNVSIIFLYITHTSVEWALRSVYM